MKIKKFLSIIFLISIIIASMATYVIAAELTINLEGESIVAPGGISTLNLKIDSEETIGVVSGIIEHDANINDITVSAKNNWNVTYNSETGKFNAYKAEGAKTQEIIEIKYTVSNTEETGIIKVSNLETVNINYESKDIEEITKEISIKKVIEKIEVTNKSSKKQYIEGENFDTEGMVVTATYNDGTTKEITDYTVTDGNSLTAEKTNVTISYTENDVTKTTTQEITVEEKLEAKLKKYESSQENGIKYIESINPNTKIQELIESIETNGEIKIYKGNTEKTDVNSIISTGMTIKISLGSQEVNCTIVVTGDLNGDGQMGNSDLLRMARYKAKIDNNLTGAYLRAADIYKDGKYADNKDLLKIARVLAKLENL